MFITKQHEDGATIIALSGRLDTITAPELQKEVESLDLKDHKVIIDCKELEYVSSAGLRVFLFAHKKLTSQGSSFAVRNVNETIMNVLELTGFNEIMTIL